MTRDYARRSGARRGRYDSAPHAGLWVFTVVLFVIFTIGLVFLGKYRQHQPLAITKSHQNLDKNIERRTMAVPIVDHGTKVSDDAQKTSIPLKSQEQPTSQLRTNNASTTAVPQIEFTTPQALEQAAALKISKDSDSSKRMVDQKNAQANAAANTATINESGVAKPGVTSSAQKIEQYLVEVIKTKNYQSADKMRARLALMGIETEIRTIKENNAAYYKLQLGPYDKATAVAKQQMLLKNNIKAILGKA